MNHRSWTTFGSIALVSSLLASASAQKRDLLPKTIDERAMVTIQGNVRPEVNAQTDRGARPESLPLSGLQLVLHRSPESQAAFTAYLAQQQDPTSPNFHNWLTNAQIGAQFGPSAADLQTVSQWLGSKGLSVNSVSPDGLVIEFDGTVGLVGQAFHTSIHNLEVNGVQQFANVTDPQLPEALTPVVLGVAKLNDFRAHTLSHLLHTPASANVKPKGVGTDGYTYLSAADLATIYNFKPLFASGITGKGQTIALIEDTDQYSVGDWQTFRKSFGLTRSYPYATLTQVHPTGTNTCTAPGANGDDGEAAIDIEWASAAAPNAAIVNAACKGGSQFGGFLALANMLQSATPPTIVSISYGEAEASNGATENLYINNLYSLAAAEGVSVFVSSGDEGAASADANRTRATHGIGVSGYTSTPYNISVGGTDFGYIPLNIPGTYFNSTNGLYYQSAISYIPEVPWNDSCAGTLIAGYLGYPTTGTGSLCNSSIANPDGLLTTGSGSGGPSNCATGVPSTRGVSNGSCKGYTKPFWQAGLGVPADGVRDIPDVSLMASNGFWGVYYAVCISDPSGNSGFTPCTGDPSSWAGFGGTSISSPIWAGIQALVNQKTGQRWGNSNPVLYSLANSEYGATGSPTCNSSLGNAVGSNCVFYDVTKGDIAVNCTGSVNCYNSGGSYGVLSTSNAVLQPAYSTNIGWDFGSGIGTTNATNLVNAWQAYATSVSH